MYPLFLHDDAVDVDISSMPGCKRMSLATLLREVEASMKVGIKSFILFPKIDDNLKTTWAEEAYNPNGLVPRAIKAIKSKFPEAIVATDIALDPYSDMGHDGVVVDGKILNDETITQLIKQALSHAEAGADIVAPSDMMDGRIGAIRDALDEAGYSDVSIISYTAKYASSFYGPFRDALDSHPGFGDKKTYQQDPSNGREALIEAALDASEGADFLMVKPAGPYMDVIYRVRQASALPIATYHVSGEYAMIKAAAKNGWVDEKKVVMETMKGLRRAGADLILTYFARQIGEWLAECDANGGTMEHCA